MQKKKIQDKTLKIYAKVDGNNIARAYTQKEWEENETCQAFHDGLSILSDENWVKNIYIYFFSRT